MYHGTVVRGTCIFDKLQVLHETWWSGTGGSAVISFTDFLYILIKNLNILLTTITALINDKISVSSFAIFVEAINLVNRGIHIVSAWIRTCKQ